MFIVGRFMFTDLRKGRDLSDFSFWENDCLAKIHIPDATKKKITIIKKVGSYYSRTREIYSM